MNGSKKNLDVSGFKIISDSLIAFHPAIDEPSKNTPSFNISSSTIVESIVKCCNLPLGSVNLKSTNSASLSLINFKTFLEFIFSPIYFCMLYYQKKTDK